MLKRDSWKPDEKEMTYRTSEKNGRYEAAVAIIAFSCAEPRIRQMNLRSVECGDQLYMSAITMILNGALNHRIFYLRERILREAGLNQSGEKYFWEFLRECSRIESLTGSQELGYILVGVWGLRTFSLNLQKQRYVGLMLI